MPLSALPFASASMRAVVSDGARLQRMLDFQRALARAQAAVGIIPASAGGEIADAARIEAHDADALTAAVSASGDPAGTLIDALTAEVARCNKRAAGFVNWGICTQDMTDTVLVLELRAALDALLTDLERAIAGFVALAGRHRRTMALGRANLQHTAPMPFGLKVAGYAAALGRSRERLKRVQKDALGLQLGGGAGTLSSLGEQGLPVFERVAALLDIPVVDAPWHGQRDRLSDVASAISILAGTCGTIARDVTLLMQTEISEVTLGPAKDPNGAAAPAHDPVVAALAAAAAVPPLVAAILAARSHDSDSAALHAERAAFTALNLTASAALGAAAEIAERLQADIDRMTANLEGSGIAMGEVLAEALAPKVGRTEAQAIVHDLRRQAADARKPLREFAEKDARVRAQLDGPELTRLFYPMGNLGAAQVFIDRLVGSTQGRLVRRTPREAGPPPPEDKLTLAAKLKSVASAATEFGSLGMPRPATGPAPAATPAESPPVEAAEHEPGALLQVFAQANAQDADAAADQPASESDTAKSA